MRLTVRETSTSPPSPEPRRYPGVFASQRCRSGGYPWFQKWVLLKWKIQNWLIIYTAQEERQYAIKAFKSGAKDVMVASGVASKGLDFNDVQHVIIFSMPKEIEDYVHQIGRTGRSGKTGISTTFVNMNTPEQTLLDLKYLLMEAGQKSVIDFIHQLGVQLYISPEFPHSWRTLKILVLRKAPTSKVVLSVGVNRVLAAIHTTSHLSVH